MKISDRDKKLILGVLLLAIILLPIFFFIKPKNEKIKALDAELAQLNERYSFLKTLSEKQPFYESEIIRLNEARNDMLEGYSAGIRQENTIMFLKDIEESIPVSMSTEAFGENIRTHISDATVDAENNPVPALDAVSSSTSVTYSCDYESIKKFLDFIFSYDEKMIISSIEMKYIPDNGQVTGIFVFDQFAIEGLGKELKEPEIPKINHGNETIFSEIEYVDEEALLEEEENEEIEETEETEETEGTEGTEE